MAQINISGSISATGVPILGRVNIVNVDANYTLSPNEYTNNYINITGALTLGRDIIAPLTTGTTYIVNNSTSGGFTIRFIGASGTGVVIAPGSVDTVVCDGINFISSSSDTVQIDFGGYGTIQSGIIEVGQYITSAKFKAVYNILPEIVILTDDDITLPKNVTSTPESFTSDGYFQHLAFGEEVNFTLTVDDYYVNNFKLIWGARNYFGVGNAGENSSEFIRGLGSLVSNSQEMLFTASADINDKIYYAHRTGYGIATLLVNGFEGGFSIVSTTIAVINPYGFIENYTLYESDNVNLGLTTVEVY